MSNYNVGDLVAEFLSNCGVTTAFGVVSIHNIPMLDAIGRRNAIRFVMARGEMGAGHMADGFARATGKLGVTISSTGPGAANAVPGLVEARFAGTPVLHLTGQTASKFVDKQLGNVHDVADQLGMLRSVSKSAYRIRTPAEALGVLTRAVVDALTPPKGPVSVEIPIDIQQTVIERPKSLDQFMLPIPARVQPSEAGLDVLAQRIIAAKRPMMWLGNGAREAGAPAAKLLELGFAMVSSWAGRGIVPEDHPMTLGALNGNGIPALQDFYRTVDLMLVVGSRLRGHETGDFSLKLPDNLIHIDIDPAANGRAYANTGFVCADSAVVLDGLLKRIKGKMNVDPAFAPAFKALKAAVQEEFRQTLGPYSDFPKQLRNVMAHDTIWVRDVTMSNTTWGNRLFPVYGPRDSIYPVGAAIGPSLSLGIGAALSEGGRKTVVMTGDGGFSLNMSELWTAVQERADMVIIIMNDFGYGVIKAIQDAWYGGRKFYGDLMGPNFEQLAALANVPFWKVSKSSEFGATVAKAIATTGPTIVEVDMGAIGAHPPYYPYIPKPQQAAAR
jgi:acetolactate synthase I/II/III large subunit